MIESLPILLTARQSQEGKLANSVVARMPTTLGDIDNLPQSLTIGGSDYSPAAYMVADDIVVGTGAWPSRHDITKAITVLGSGTAPTYGNPTSTANTSAVYAAAKYHAAGDGSWGINGDNDFAIEVVATVTAGTEIIFSGRNSGTFRGPMVYNNGTVLLSLLADGTSSVTVGGGANPVGGIVHAMFFLDKGVSYYSFTNGVFTNRDDSVSAFASIAGEKLGIGAYSNGVAPFAGGVISAAIWNLATNPFPGSGTNQAVMGVIAAERFAAISGINCSKNTTYSFTRASSAYADRYTTSTVRSLFPVSAGWPRVCERKDADGNTVVGYLSELQYTNDFLYSEDATQWAQVRCTVSSNAAVAPDGTTTADGIISDAGNNTHYVNLECAADASQHVFSCWLKAGAQNWARMDIHTQANAYVYFDISASAGAIGTVGADITSYGIEPWGNGWYRCWIEYTGAAPAHDHHIHTCVANDGQTWDSPGSVVDMYVWGAQHENAGSVLPTSYIKTAAAAATRIKDSLVRVVPTIGTGKVFAKCTTLLGTSHNSTQSKTIFAVDNITS